MKSIGRELGEGGAKSLKLGSAERAARAKIVPIGVLEPINNTTQYTPHSIFVILCLWDGTRREGASDVDLITVMVVVRRKVDADSRYPYKSLSIPFFFAYGVFLSSFGYQNLASRYQYCGGGGS